MYCEKCGYKLRRGVKSCAQCGAQTPYNRSRSVVLIIAAVILTIAGFAAVIIADNGNELPVIIIDILAVAAILIGLFVGVRRGFLYGTFSTVLLAIVFSVSIFSAQTLAPLIYDGLIRNSISDSVNNAISSSDPLEHVTDSDDEIMSMIVGNDLFTSESIINSAGFVVGEEEVAQAVRDTVSAYFAGDNVGEIVESRIFEPLIVYCLEVILCMVLVLLLRFLMSLIMRIFKLLEGIHIPYALDVIFGTVEGIAGGAAWVCYAAALVGIAVILIMLFGSDFDATVTETIENTAVFGHFFRLVEHLGI
ncbi:MAG: zinc ribbon domain-containing protein [Oscillospiraceae bacterium]|nr:zinc ribbon domain-containing protein [Oscillospiraceae bacterium]